MSLVNELREARAALEASKRRLDALQSDPKVQRYQDFESKLRNLMGQFSMSLVDVNQLLDTAYKPPKVKAAVQPAPPKGKVVGKSNKPRKTRSTRTYTNPNNGEVLVYFGGINKILEGWKEKWGADVVKGWGVLNKSV